MVRQKKSEGVPTSGALHCEKALELSNILQGEETKSKASEGWKQGFCKTHGIRRLSFQGEKLSIDKEAADEFVTRFRKLARSCHLTKYLTVMKLA